MKTNYIFQTLAILFCALSATAQQGINYKAIINDANGDVLANTPVIVQFTILENGTTNVYQESHTPGTDDNGILIVNIGEGTPISGDFTTVDWGSNPHFLKTEINSGDGLTDMGTTEFKAVPYALHAKTVENITETDPLYSASQAANITAADITNLDNLSGVNTGDQDLSNLALKSNVLELNNTTAFTPDEDYEPATKKYVDDNTAVATTYSIGDFAQGGIVFWLDETGQHGLVCAKTDQDGGSGIQWYNGSYTDTEAHGDGVYAGEMNTMLIIANQGSNSYNYAAGVCANLIVLEGGVTYGDWYFPSKEELNLMYQNKATIDATATANGGSAFASGGYYWSSTENYDAVAWFQGFLYGGQDVLQKHFATEVRAVRAF